MKLTTNIMLALLKYLQGFLQSNKYEILFMKIKNFQKESKLEKRLAEK